MYGYYWFWKEIWVLDVVSWFYVLLCIRICLDEENDWWWCYWKVIDDGLVLL